ncbi:hypothetical protein RHO14_03510 [Orbus wheelerorum]|uniref:hypothetical protein n=1 Tax=Orbus wheelerorum TaxID=3074111 RepID=UPI00370D1F16
MERRSIIGVAGVAKMLIANLLLYSEGKRVVNKCKLGLNTLRVISGRKVISDKFFSELQEECLEFGFILCRDSKNMIGLINSEQLDSWVKLSSKRVMELSSEQIDAVLASLTEEDVKQDD